MFADLYKFKIITDQDNILEYDENLEIIYILEGDGLLVLPQSNATYKLSKSDIFVLNSFQSRSIDLSKDSLAISLTIDLSFIVSNVIDENLLFFEAKSFLFDDDNQGIFNDLRRIFAKAFYTYYKEDSNLDILMRLYLMELISILSINFKEEIKISYDSNLDYLRQVINYIHLNYKNNLSLDELASHVGLSGAYLSRMFRDSMNMTLTDYITELKIKHASKLLLSDKTLTDIAYESGFPSHNAMIAAFKKHLDTTPTKYRNNLINNPKDSTLEVSEDDFSTAFAHLISFLNDDFLSAKTGVLPIKEVFVNAKESKGKISNSFKNVINIGYANKVLDKNIQNQIERIQNEVNFKYFRIKGILDDDMMVYTKGFDGSTIINFVYVDEVINFILENNAKPFIQIGHMPKALVKEPFVNIRATSNIGLPNDIEIWYKLVKELIEHLVVRFGYREVSTWIFSPWINPNYSDFGLYTIKEYFETYKHSYKAIREVIKPALIVGPGSEIVQQKTWKEFIELAIKDDVLPDVFSFISFSIADSKTEKEDLHLNITADALPYAVTKNENYLSSGYFEAVKHLSEYGLEDLPILIEEWSNNIWQRDFANDTLFKSSFLFKNILEHSHLYSSIAYHALLDQLDEVVPQSCLFCGGFGLFTREGIAKSAFYAYTFLAKMGDRLLDKGDGYFISKKDDNYQIFLYNFTHYDMLYRYRHTTNLTTTNRYEIFNNKESIIYNIQLSNLEAGDYEVCTNIIDRENGSAYDTWISMGAIESLTKSELKYIENKSIPKYSKTDIFSDGILNINHKVKPHETIMVEIRKKA